MFGEIGSETAYILLNHGSDISLAPIMEGFVILKKNPDYEKAES